jgi:hypothetical protein
MQGCAVSRRLQEHSVALNTVDIDYPALYEPNGAQSRSRLTDSLAEDPTPLQTTRIPAT